MTEPPTPPHSWTPLPAVQPAPASRPAVLLWQNVYCLAMAAVYLLCAALGVGFLLFSESLADAKTSATENLIVGALLLAVALPLAALYVAAPFVPRRPWAWVYHIVLIALSLTSCACMPFAIPLLIFWIEPRVQAWFGRQTAVVAAPPPPPPAYPGARA